MGAGGSRLSVRLSVHVLSLEPPNRFEPNLERWSTMTLGPCSLVILKFINSFTDTIVFTVLLLTSSNSLLPILFFRLPNSFFASSFAEHHDVHQSLGMRSYLFLHDLQYVGSDLITFISHFIQIHSPIIVFAVISFCCGRPFWFMG